MRGGISEVSVTPWPTAGVATTSRSVTAYGGATLLRDVMSAVGLVEEVDANVGLKQRARGLTEGEFVAAMAESIALGASCLDDLAVARSDAAQGELRGFAVPAPQTAGAWLRRFYLGHVLQLGKAMAAMQRRAYTLAEVKQVTLDFDSTYVFSRSKRRQGADRTYKKAYALHPLVCFDAASGAAVHARLRRGKANTAAGMKTFLTEALRAVPDGVAVRARFDSGFYSGALFELLNCCPDGPGRILAFDADSFAITRQSVYDQGKVVHERNTRKQGRSLQRVADLSHAAVRADSPAGCSE